MNPLGADKGSGPPGGRQVSLGMKASFAMGASAETVMNVAFNAFNFFFYNQVVGLSGTLCGLAVTIALVFDALSDPLVGSLSDRWHSRLGSFRWR